MSCVPSRRPRPNGSGAKKPRWGHLQPVEFSPEVGPSPAAGSQGTMWCTWHQVSFTRWQTSHHPPDLAHTAARMAGVATEPRGVVGIEA